MEKKVYIYCGHNYACNCAPEILWCTEKEIQDLDTNECLKRISSSEEEELCFERF